MHFAGRILCHFHHKATIFDVLYCPYRCCCFICLDRLLMSVVIIYGIRITFRQHPVDGRPKWHFFMPLSKCFQVLAASCRQEHIFQGSINSTIFQILLVSCRQALKQIFRFDETFLRPILQINRGVQYLFVKILYTLGKNPFFKKIQLEIPTNPSAFKILVCLFERVIHISII